MIILYATVLVLAFYAAIIAWIVYPAASSWLRQKVCRHRETEYMGQVVPLDGHRIVAVRCLRCDRIEYGNSLGKVVWESDGL